MIRVVLRDWIAHRWLRYAARGPRFRMSRSPRAAALTLRQPCRSLTRFRAPMRTSRFDCAVGVFEDHFAYAYALVTDHTPQHRRCVRGCSRVRLLSRQSELKSPW